MPKQSPKKKDKRKAVVEDTLLLNAVQRYFKLAGVVGAVWLVGYTRFSVSWLLLALVLYVWKERTNKAKEHKTRIAQEIAKDEKSVILARVEDLPSWVNFPDVERAEWINKILDQMWPYIGEYVEKILRTSVENSIKDASPSLKSFKFIKIDLGDIPPRIGGVKVYSQLKRDEIYMDLELNYSSDADIVVNLKGMNAGIKDLRIHGTLRVVMKPLINRIPLIGGMLVFFLNNPDLDFNLTGLTNALDLPGVSSMLHSIIGEQIANFMVLPNRFPIQMTTGLDLNKLRYPQPQGVVRINVLEAKDLIKADMGLTGKGKSDPYVVVKLGAKSEKTRIIDNTVNPVWNETFEMIVDSADGQMIYLDVFDDDNGSKDDFLGRVNMDLSRLRDEGMQDEWLPLEEVKSGLVHVRLTWLWLANDPLELDRQKKVIQKVQDLNHDKEKSHAAILMVFLDSAFNLPVHTQRSGLGLRGKKSLQEPSPQATLSVGQTVQESVVKYNTNEPCWESNFRFMVMNPAYQNLEVELTDTKNKKIIGGTTIRLKDMLTSANMIMDQKFLVKTSEPGSYINMRLCLRILTPNANPEWMEDPEALIDHNEVASNTDSSVDPEDLPAGTSVDTPPTPTQPAAASAGKAPKPATTSSASAGNAPKPAATSSAPSSTPVPRSSTTVDAPTREAVVSSAKTTVVSSAKTTVTESGVRQRQGASVNSAGDFGLGRLQMTVRYSRQREMLILVIHKMSNLKPVEGDSKGLADPYVKMYLLPDKSSSSKRKTKVVDNNLNPVFDETFEYEVPEQDLMNRQLELSVKNDVGMFSKTKEKMGKILIDMGSLDTGKAVTEWFDICPEDGARTVTFESDV